MCASRRSHPRPFTDVRSDNLLCVVSTGDHDGVLEAVTCNYRSNRELASYKRSAGLLRRSPASGLRKSSGASAWPAAPERSMFPSREMLAKDGGTVELTLFR